MTASNDPNLFDDEWWSIFINKYIYIYYIVYSFVCHIVWSILFFAGNCVRVTSYEELVRCLTWGLETKPDPPLQSWGSNQFCQTFVAYAAYRVILLVSTVSHPCAAWRQTRNGTSLHLMIPLWFAMLRSDLPRRAVSEVFLFFPACNLIKGENLQMDLSEPRHVEQRYYAPRPHTADAVSLFEVGVLDKNGFLTIKYSFEFM